MPAFRAQAECGGHHVPDIGTCSCASDLKITVIREVFLDVLPDSLGVVGAPLISHINWNNSASKMPKPFFDQAISLRNFIDTGIPVASEIRGDCHIFIRGEIIQCELPIVHQEYPTLYLPEIPKESWAKALGERPHVVSAVGGIEVRIGGGDVLEQLLVEDGGACEVVRVVVDQEAAAVYWDVEEISLTGLQCAALAVEQKLME